MVSGLPRTAADLIALQANTRREGPTGIRSCMMPPTVQRYDHRVRPLDGRRFWAVPQTNWATCRPRPRPAESPDWKRMPP